MDPILKVCDKHVWKLNIIYMIGSKSHSDNIFCDSEAPT